MYLTSLLPWIRSGDVTRNAYAVADVAKTLGLAEEGLYRAFVFGWYFMPAAVALVFLATVLERAVVAGAIAMTVGGASLAFAIGVARAPLSVETGPVLGGAVGIMTVLLGGAQVVRNRTPQ